MNQKQAQRLKILLRQLDIPNAQLAHALSVDPALVWRWMREGFGKRSASRHARAVGTYIAGKNLSAENRSWLRSEIGLKKDMPITAQSIARWLDPDAELPVTEEYANPEILDAFRINVAERDVLKQPETPYSIVGGIDSVSGLLKKELSLVKSGSRIDIYLSSEHLSCATDKQLIALMRECTREKDLTWRVLVQSANNSVMSSRLIAAYMPLLVQGRLTLSMIQGTPQSFTASMNIMIPSVSALMITEVLQKKSAVVTAVIREAETLEGLLSNFEETNRYARSMMTAYDDSFATSIVEVFYEEYCLPGSLDVIKCGMNPMYFRIEEYGDVLRKHGHTGDQYQWRIDQFIRFSEGMQKMLAVSRSREVLSIPKLREIAETGVCRMPSMYFFDAGIIMLDREDCVRLFDGYIRCLSENNDFHVILLDDESAFLPNSCWHIKNNKHIMIHSWNIDSPVMVFSDQLMLIDEFQRHFDGLWAHAGEGISDRSAVDTLTELRGICARGGK